MFLLLLFANGINQIFILTSNVEKPIYKLLTNCFKIFFISIQNWYVLYRSANISPIITLTHANGTASNGTGQDNGSCHGGSQCYQSGSAHQTSSLNNYHDTSDVHHNNYHHHHSPLRGATDTIPLLCSAAVTTPPATIVNSRKIIVDELIIGGGIDAMQDINLWETSMENVNLECISTISNQHKVALEYVLCQPHAHARFGK